MCHLRGFGANASGTTSYQYRFAFEALQLGLVKVVRSHSGCVGCGNGLD